MLGLETTHIMLFWFKAQVQILYLVAFHNCNCMTWVSNGIDFDAWLLFLSMINDFIKYSNSMDFHFACLKAMTTTDVNTLASNPEV